MHIFINTDQILAFGAKSKLIYIKFRIFLENQHKNTELIFSYLN